MRDLNYDLKKLCRSNRDGSYQTRANREKILAQAADQLHALGFRHMHATSIKAKHVDALVKLWKSHHVSVGTIKNRMAALRWWANKVNKQYVVASNNAGYGIEQRIYLTNESKSKTVSSNSLAKISDAPTRMALELQQAFGLRREEALKFSPSYADLGDKIRLKGSWTKGGRPREVRIRNETQRDVLRRAHALAGRGSLIPPNRTYIQQLRIYERQTASAGLCKMHGLRHRYAQDRYQELTGRSAPAEGGPTAKQLSGDEHSADLAARTIISRELGHSRPEICNVYLGK